ncbi:hypothetical protein HZB06_02245 [Candidatus Wolfebacteria bacterium]|nr:hypothetical protein [Candidatus Wolfebacteria bacterium]
MKILNSKFKIFTLLAIGYWLLAISANAQSAPPLASLAESGPQFLASWKADSYVPSWYGGKTLPSAGSNIRVSFELIDNNKIADLSRIVVRWYVDDDLISNEDEGLGIKSVKIRAPIATGDDIKVRIAVVGYKDIAELNKIVNIPVGEPEAIIDFPRYNNSAVNRSGNIFRAMPFFFNLKNSNGLSVNWLANDRNAKESGKDPWRLDLTVDDQTPSGFEISLEATIQNVSNQLDYANKILKLKVK